MHGSPNQIFCMCNGAAINTQVRVVSTVLYYHDSWSLGFDRSPKLHQSSEDTDWLSLMPLYCGMLGLGRMRDLGDELFVIRLHTHTAASRRLSVGTRYRSPLDWDSHTLSGGVVTQATGHRLPVKQGPFIVQAHTTSSPMGEQTTQTTVEDDIVSHHRFTITIG